MAFINAFGAIGRLLVVGAVLVGVVGSMSDGDARVALLVVAASIGVTGLVFTLIGFRLGRLSWVDSRLRQNGVEGRATITSVRPTGVSINGESVLELGLDVDVTSHAPYSVAIRQQSPRLEGIVAPGATVGVVVDPDDADHLAIDWAAVGPEQSEAPPQEVEPRFTAESQARDAAHLLQTGRRAKAIIISMADAGDMSELGLVEVGHPGDDDRLFIVDMEVQQAGLDPYEVRVAHRVPERLVGRVGPRTTVRVAIDRDDEHAVAIDWSTVGR
jgi:hypothetical protein